MSTTPIKTPRPIARTVQLDPSNRGAAFSEYMKVLMAEEAKQEAMIKTLQDSITSSRKARQGMHFLMMKASMQNGNLKHELKTKSEELTKTREDLAKEKDERKHAVAKAKEYKMKMKILEEKLVKMGGSVEDVRRTYGMRKRGLVESESSDEEDKVVANPSQRRRLAATKAKKNGVAA